MISAQRIPEAVAAACRTLQQNGFAAYVVGGAIRDLLLFPHDDRAKDFDLTTSARPEEVSAVFGKHRVIPTGIAHGTVTVLIPSHVGKPHPIEITTFRGEVGFSDGRRPDRVEFITDLTEDLRRRDFTINAIAFDPIARRLFDPFDGQADLARGLIRAVGDPVARFSEDGLRVMRAVRFAAQLGFSVEPDTRAAFLTALPTLRRVSRERVREELLKLLRASSPERGLRLLCSRELPNGTLDFLPEHNILHVVFPELAPFVKTAAALSQVCAVVGDLPLDLRLLGFLWPLRTWLAEEGAVVAATPRALGELLDERLKLPSDKRQFLVALLTTKEVSTELLPHLHGPALRRFLAEHPQPVLDALLALQLAQARTQKDHAAESSLRLFVETIEAERAQKPPLFLSDLALSGKDLLVELSLSPGPVFGELLHELLSQVHDEPEKNTREQLLEHARIWLLARKNRR